MDGWMDEWMFTANSVQRTDGDKRNAYFLPFFLAAWAASCLA